MAVTITGVYDEGAIEDAPLIGAKGFSVLIDTEDARFLVDTGLRGRYLRHNLENLEIDPESIDALIVTQLHPDNCAAVNGLLEARESPLKIYGPEQMFVPKKGLPIGRKMTVSEENMPKAVPDTDAGWIEIAPEVAVTPFIGGERFVLVKGKRLTLVSGRGAAGPAEPFKAVHDRFGRYPDAYLGSVLLEKKKKPVAASYANEFDACGCKVLYLNHATGRDGMLNLRTNLGLDGVNDFYVGSVYKA